MSAFFNFSLHYEDEMWVFLECGLWKVVLW